MIAGIWRNFVKTGVASRIDRTRLINMILRVVPMASKLLLTFYAGRYLPLDDLGTYGLVFAAVMILTSLLGQSFTYVVIREIVDVAPAEALKKIRDQLVLYGINYGALALTVCLFTLLNFEPLPTGVLWLVVILTTLEGVGSVLWNDMNAMRQQVWANVIFCIRSGLWVPPVVLLGIWEPSLRNVSLILWGWTGGCLASFVLVFYLWRGMPWSELARSSVDWHWISNGVRRSFPVWIGALGLATGIYLDRFIIERSLSLADVGVITFYGTFTNALIALLQAGVLAFAVPGLVRRYRDQEHEAFATEARQTVLHASVVAAVAAFCFAVLVPVLGILTQRPTLIDHLGVFWVMLVGVWFRAAAEALQIVLFACHQDKPIWLGNLLFLIPAIGANAALIPLLGLMGAALSSVLAGAFLLGWRGIYARAAVDQRAFVKQDGRYPLSNTG